MGLETRIGASRLGFEPQGWDRSPKAGIWVLKPGRGLTEEEEKKKEEEKEKISHMCESIGHRPLRGRCPKGKIYANYGKKKPNNF